MQDPTPTGPNLEAMLAHSGWVRALARSLVADPHLADDIEQQTWLTAMRRPPKSDTNLRSWLGSVVRSMAGMHWRESEARRRREKVVAERREGQAERGADDARPESLSERMETFRELASAVAELPEPYGTAVYLRYFEELPVREVARRTRVPEPTAQSHITRGVDMLRARVATRLGESWRQRCLVFTLPLAKAPWGGIAALSAMTMKTKLLTGAAVVALLSLFTIQPWATEPVEPVRGEVLAAAELEPSETEPEVEPMAVASVERETLVPEDATVLGGGGLEEAKMLTLHVRDAVSLEPVPSAEVWYFDHATDPEEDWRRASRLEYLDSEQLIERFGHPVEVGADGAVQVPFPEGFAQVFARVEGKYAYKFHHPDFYSPGDEPELLLKSVRTQEVKVVDQDGLPLAGIEVQFCPEPAEDAAHARESVVTDAAGRAVFRHLEDVLREDRPEWKNTLAVPIPGVEPAFVELTATEIGKAPIEFVVPPTGEVHVTCLNADGSFVPDGTPIFLNMHRNRGGGVNRVFHAYLRLNGSIAYVKSGVARFRDIGVDSTFMIIARVRGTNGSKGKTGRGPQEAGGIATVEIRFRESRPTLTFEVRDAEGHPPASGFYSLFAETVSPVGEHGGLGHSPFLGEQGLFEFTLPEAFDAENELLRLLLHDAKEEPLRSTSFGLAEIDLKGEMSEDVRIFPYGAENIVAGRLQDRDGVPISATRMILRVHDRRVEEGHAGAYVTYLHVRTDDDGSFQFRGPAPTEFLDYTLHLPSPGFNESWGADPAVDFRFGQDDLAVEMDPVHAFQGRLLVSDPAILPRLTIRGREANVAGGFRFLDIPIEVPNGRFAKDGLSLAKTEFQLVERSTGRILDTRQVRADEAGDFTWDMRESLFLHRLRFRTPETGEELRVILDRSRGDTLTFDGQSGEVAEVLVKQEVLRGHASVLGYRRQQVVSHGEAEVFLEQGIPVTLLLADGVEFPEDVRWRLSLRHFDLDDWGADLRQLPELQLELDSASLSEGRFEILLPAAGAWLPSITPLTEQHGMTSANPGSLLPEPKGFEIEDSAAGQAFTLEFHQEAIDAFAQSVRDRK